MSDLISVIIPVYNVEKYISTCVESIVFQTCKNIEIIIVDDGSTDNTKDICDKLANEFFYIKVFHQKNSGVSSARNRGLDMSTGEWIFFLDGDDSLLPNALDMALSYAKETGCKMVDFNYSRVGEDHTVKKKLVYKVNNIEYSSQCLRGTLLYNRALIYPKLYHRSLIGENRFNTNIKIGEDILFNIQLYLGNEFLIGHNVNSVYLYLLREGSAMQNERTYLGYNILNDEMSSCLNKYDQFQLELNLFCCINLYFKGIKEKSSLDKKMYDRYFSVLSLRDCLICDLSVKFKILFIAYKLSRNIGNLILFIRYSIFAIH